MWVRVRVRANCRSRKSIYNSGLYPHFDSVSAWLLTKRLWMLKVPDNSGTFCFRSHSEGVAARLLRTNRVELWVAILSQRRGVAASASLLLQRPTRLTLQRQLGSQIAVSNVMTPSDQGDASALAGFGASSHRFKKALISASSFKLPGLLGGIVFSTARANIAQ
jgi:hypothetical protein